MKTAIIKTLEKVLLDGAERDPEFALTVVTKYQTYEGVKALSFDDIYLHDVSTRDRKIVEYAVIKIITDDGDYHINPHHIVSF